jgi:hypothetical protein
LFCGHQENPLVLVQIAQGAANTNKKNDDTPGTPADFDPSDLFELPFLRSAGDRNSSQKTVEQWCLSEGMPAPAFAVDFKDHICDLDDGEAIEDRPQLFAAPFFGAQLDGANIMAIEDSQQLQNWMFDDDSPFRFAFVPLGFVHNPVVRRQCDACLAAFATFRPRPQQNVREAEPAAPVLNPKMSPTADAWWPLRVAKDDAAQVLVRQSISFEGGSIAEYTSRVGSDSCSTSNDVPAGLRSLRDRPARDPRWRQEPFSVVLVPPTTAPLPPDKPPRTTTWRPKQPADLLTEKSFTDLCAWLESNAKDIEWMRLHGEGGKRPFKPRPLILGESSMVEEARGTVWDLRDPDNIKPLDSRAEIKSDFNLHFLDVLMSSCPDRELRSHVSRGAHFKADVPLQTVLLPHMKSLAGRVDLVQKEIERLRGLGWHQAFQGIPFFPCRILPNGAVARKLEPDRLRRTTNASAPEEDLVDQDGVAVMSLNVAIKADNKPEGNDTTQPNSSATSFMPPASVRLYSLSPPPDPSVPYLPPGVAVGGDGLRAASAAPVPAEPPPLDQKWPKEQKPTVLNKVHDIGVLQYAAQVVFRDEVVGFVTDWKDYFSQFAVFPGDLWMNVVHWSNLEGIETSDLGCFVSEQRLGFGASSSSNITQRFAHFIASVFRRAFDREEELVLAAEQDPVRRAYLDERQTLGPGQCRLYEISIFTDDPFFVCVGAARLTRALKLWHRLMKAVGLQSAIPAKRQCGNKLRWPGLDWMLGLGVLLIPTNKRLRALGELKKMAGGEEMPFDDYRSIVSFLQYLRPFVLGIDKSLLYGVYQPFRKNSAGMLPTATTSVKMSVTVMEQATRWVEILSTTAGMCFSDVLDPQPLSPSTPWAYLYSDAALLGAPVPGLGGYLDGFNWALPLSGDELLLPISVLEFVAIGINVITFERLVRGSHAIVCSDSLNSVQVLNAFSAKSQLMQFVHSRVLALPASKRLAGKSSFVHCFGPSNPAADHLSRGEQEKFRDFCAKIGVAPVPVPVPVEARQLLSDTVAFAREHGLLLAVSRTATDLQAERRVGKRYSSDVTGDGPPTPIAQLGFEASERRRRQALVGRVLAAACTSTKAPPVYLRPTAPPAPIPQKESFTQNDLGAAAIARRQRAALVPLTVESDSSSTGNTRKRPLAVEEASHPAGRPRPSAEPSWAVVGPPDSHPTRAARRPPSRTDTRRVVRLAAVHDRALTLATLLAEDPSPLALRPRDPEALLRLSTAVLRASEDVPAAGTLRADDLAWERWTTYCATMGTPPIRSDILANAGLDYLGSQRETLALCGFLMHCAESMTGREGKGRAKPGTINQQVLAVRRIHVRLNAPMGALPGVRRVFIALVKAYVELHGPDALMPKRKEPLDAARIAKMLALPNGTRLGRRTLNWTDPFFVVLKAVFCTGFAAAFRKAEMLPPSAEGTLACLTRASVSWLIDGALLANPSDEQLRNLKAGDYCVIKPPPCKNDVFGLHFGWKPIWLPVGSASTNAAKAIAEMFLAIPVDLCDYGSTPLFCMSSQGTRFLQGDADRLLSHMLKAAFPLEDSTRWSMHSLRIGAACALLKANASYELIQALCRWRSTKSLEIYARLGPADYGRWVLRASQQQTDAVTARNLPRIDYDGVVGILSGMAEELDD